MSARASDPPSTTRKPRAVSAARSRSRPCAAGAGIAAAATTATTGPLVAAGCAAAKKQTTAHVRNRRIVMASRVRVPFVDRVQDSDFAERRHACARPHPELDRLRPATCRASGGGSPSRATSRPSPSSTASRVTVRGRLHLTPKREATKPAGDNLLRQQARFDTFMTRCNEERPHAALAMKTPRSSTHRRRASRWPVRTSASPRSATASGSSASWNATWAISTTRPSGSNRSTTASEQECYLCARYDCHPCDRNRRNLAPRAGLGTASAERSEVQRFPVDQAESHERSRRRSEWLLGLDSNQQPSG